MGSESICSECETELQEVAVHRGYIFWCPGCGCLFRRIGHDGDLSLTAKPGIIAALRLLAARQPAGENDE